MRKIEKPQECETAEIAPCKSDPKIKCVTVMVFEDNGKTIIQPLVTGQDAQSVQELLQKKTLEVWLPNGQSALTQFDVSILKYKQVIQPSKMCSNMESQQCLKNHFETIVSCEQCSFCIKGAQK